MLKKILLIIVVLLLTISSIGCNSEEFQSFESTSDEIIDVIESFSGEDVTDKTIPSPDDDRNETTERIDSSELFLVTEDGRYVFCAYQTESQSDRKDTYKYKDYRELNLVSSQYSHSCVDET